MVFDVIFPRGTRLPGPGEPLLAVERRYEPAHNVGHYRYIEAANSTVEGSRRATSRCGTKCG